MCDIVVSMIFCTPNQCLLSKSNDQDHIFSSWIFVTLFFNTYLCICVFVCVCMWVYVCLSVCVYVWVCCRHSERSPTSYYGLVRDCTGLFGIVQDCSGLYGIVWDCTAPYPTERCRSNLWKSGLEVQIFLPVHWKLNYLSLVTLSALNT